MIKQFEIVNRQGKVLRGIATIPDTQKKNPVVINLHGFTGTMGGFNSSHVYMARQLLKENIACVRFDFYGNGESDGDFYEMTFTKLLEDTEDVFNWTKKQSWVDNDRIALSGHSLGGFVAASSASILMPKILVLISPGAGMWYGCKERSESMLAQGIEYGDISGLKFNHAFNFDLANYHPFEDAKGYYNPVLILRGVNDGLVDDNVCREYCNLYGDNAKYVQIEDGDHTFSTIQTRYESTQEIVNFIKELL